MAEKKTLQHENNLIGFVFLTGLLSVVMSWLYFNQFVMNGIGDVRPTIQIGKTGVMIIFWLLAVSLLTGGYFLWKKHWRKASFSFFSAGLFVLSVNGGLYDPSLLFYYTQEYSVSSIPRYLLIWGSLYVITMMVVIWGAIRPRGPAEKGVHGTAEVQLGDHYTHKGFKVGGEGEIVIGRHKKSNKILTFKGEKHLVTVAPTRSGKGVGSIIPNLLHYPNSVIVVDPKGENCNFTAEHRQNKFGHKIICLDPFRESIWGKENGTNHFNPLDAIPNTFQKAFRPCNALVDTIFSEEIKGDPFWSRRAKNLYLGFLIYICTAPEFNNPDHPDYHPDLRNLSTVNHLFSIPAEDLMAYIEKISVSDVPLNVKKFANDVLSAGVSVKMLIGIMETLKSEIQLFHSPELSSVMSHSDFSYDEVATGKATIYLIVPPEELRTYSKWTRIMITMFIQRAIYIRKTRLQEAREEKILFLIDEFTNLGKLNIVRDNYSIAGGYGLQFWIIFQDLGQLKLLYKQSWQSFFSNADIVQVFGVNDIDTAEYISRTLGDTTIVSVSKSKNQSTGFRNSGGKGTSKSEQKRRLYNADEVKRFPRNLQFIITNGENPVIAKKIQYYRDPEFKDYTPTQTQVFSKLRSLPVWFDIDNDDLSLERKLRLLIHGEARPDHPPAEDSNEIQLSVDNPDIDDLEEDDHGDDMDISMF